MKGNGMHSSGQSGSGSCMLKANQCSSAHLEHLIIMVLKLVQLLPQVSEIMQADLHDHVHSAMSRPKTAYQAC